MRATKVLQKYLGEALHSMHALRSRVLLHAVEAMIQGRRLTLIDLARSRPGAERIRAPLKAIDRFLSNRRLHAEREHFYQAMARWLVRSNQPIIVIDWWDLKSDRSWHLCAQRFPWVAVRCRSWTWCLPAANRAHRRPKSVFYNAWRMCFPMTYGRFW